MTLIDVINIKNNKELLTIENCHYPLLKSMLYGKIEAKIFIDNLTNPTTIFVIGNNGWCYQIGSTIDKSINDWIQSYVVEIIRSDQQPILWFGIPQLQRAGLEVLDFVEVRDYPRYKFEFDQNKFKQKSLNEIEYEIEEINMTNIENFTANYAEFEVFWSDKKSFLNNGFGFVAILNGEILGHAASASVNDREVEIDLFTNENYRGKGISAHLTYKLIEKCNVKNLVPKWDCATSNKASVRLAQKFGFKIVEEYQFSYIVGKPNQNIILDKAKNRAKEIG